MSEDAMEIDGFDFDPNSETQWIELDAILKANDSSSSINVIQMKPTPPPSSSGRSNSSPFTSALRILFQNSSSSRLINAPAAEISTTADNSGHSDTVFLSTIQNNQASQSKTSKALGFISSAASRLIPWSSGRKTTREEVFSPPPFGVPDDVDEGIKAMRGGSLNRVIASSVAAGSMIDNDLTQKLKLNGQNNEDVRKEIMQSFFTKLNRCDVNGLVKIIRNCHELCWLSTPDVFEPVVGRSDIMMLLSLILETYPDGVWMPSAVSFLSPCNAYCTFRFTGTRVFDHPINALYRQIKVHIQSTCDSSLQTESSQQLVNDVTEYAVPTDNMMLDGDDRYSNQQQQQQHVQCSSNHSSYEDKRTMRSGSDAPPRLMNTLQQQQYQQDVNGGSETIRFPRRANSMRETKAIEAAILKEGPTSYRRQLEFMYNESNEIVRIVFTNIL